MKDTIYREDAIGACAYETIECYEARKAIRALPSADRPQKWIPCSERLPKEDGYYLITLDFEWGREIEIGLWTDEEWYNDNHHANIAWMPMIEPWEGADDVNR